MPQRARSSLLALSAAMLGCFGCASVRPPMPPSLHIPSRITDLAAVERGDRIILEFTLPALTTDGVPIKQLGEIDVRIGPAGGTGKEKTQRLSAGPEAPGPAHFDVPDADWVGSEIGVAVRVAGRTGRFSGLSNAVLLRVVPPLAMPMDVKAEAVPSGVRLTWRGTNREGVNYRIYRRGPGQTKPELFGQSEAPEYVDTSTQYGKAYEYSVQAALKAGAGEAESTISVAVSITPRDIFPPAVPTGLTAIAAVQAIQLSWNPDTELDLKGYYLYRSIAGQPFERIGGLLDTPAYSDRAIESGKRYRYAVSAIDQVGNESARSAPVEAVAP